MFTISRVELYTFDQVPEHFRESFILSGYRNPRSTVYRCILSIFQLTNETLNIWTHLIPSIYFGWKIINFWQNLDALAFPYMIPLIVYLVAMFGLPFVSMIAHVFNVMSDKARHACFFVDYWSVSLFAFATALAFRAYSFTDYQLSLPYVDLYLPGAALISTGSLLISCRTRFMRPGCRRKVVRFVSFAVPYLFDLMPIFHRLVSVNNTLIPSHEANYFHVRQTVFATLSAFLYGTHIPERLFPGKFDIIGHSHQLFHVTSAIGSHEQLLALMLDSAAREQPSSLHFSVHVLMAIVAVVNSFVLLYFVNCINSSSRPLIDHSSHKD